MSCLHLGTTLGNQYNKALIEILVSNNNVQTKILLKQDTANSSFSLFTPIIRALFSVLLIPVDVIVALQFQTNDFELSDEVKSLTKNHQASSLFNHITQLTSNLNCRLNIKLFAKFICLDGFPVTDGMEIGGFSVFMFVPEAYQLSAKQQED